MTGGGNDFKTNWEAFQKERKEGKKKREKNKKRRKGEKEKKKKKDKRTKIEVWWAKKNGKQKDDFAVKILGSFSNRAWKAFKIDGTIYTPATKTEEL